MKIPLRFQITEFDCGTVALQNAISYLFEREEIPAELVRAISKYTIDCYDDKGNLSETKEAVAQMTNWITEYANSHDDFGLKVTKHLNNNVNVNNIKECIDKGGCVLFKTRLESIHFVTITGMDDEYVYLWDPYYLDVRYFDLNSDISIILDEPFKCNRIIKLDRFKSEELVSYSLGSINNRECLCFNRE